MATTNSNLSAQIFILPYSGDGDMPSTIGIRPRISTTGHVLSKETKEIPSVGSMGPTPEVLRTTGSVFDYKQEKQISSTGVIPNLRSVVLATGTFPELTSVLESAGEIADSELTLFVTGDIGGGEEGGDVGVDAVYAIGESDYEFNAVWEILELLFEFSTVWEVSENEVEINTVWETHELVVAIAAAFEVAPNAVAIGCSWSTQAQTLTHSIITTGAVSRLTRNTRQTMNAQPGVGFMTMRRPRRT